MPLIQLSTKDVNQRPDLKQNNEQKTNMTESTQVQPQKFWLLTLEGTLR